MRGALADGERGVHEGSGTSDKKYSEGALLGLVGGQFKGVRDAWSGAGTAAVLLGFWLCYLLPGGQAQAGYAAIVLDAETGRVLYESNADTLNYPASLTKMMTLYLVFEALEGGRLRLEQPLPVSRRAAGMPPSRLGLKAGSTIRVEDAILALVIKSANDIAVVLAEALGGSESAFATMMTRKARALGMERTTFRNASGLPNRGQLSSARDMATLSRALLHDYPARYRYFSTPRFIFAGRTYRNYNHLLSRYPGADGLKTGYTRASGFNLAASAVHDGRRLITVVFGGKTARWRDRHVAMLLDRGFARVTIRQTLQAVVPPTRKPLPSAVATSREHEHSIALGGQIDPPQQAPGTMSAQLALAEMPDGGRYGVQVGAYYRYELAVRRAVEAASHAPELLSQTQVSVHEISGRRGLIYLARFVGLSKAHAKRACRRLEAIRIDCLVVRVGHSVDIALDQTAPTSTPN